MAGTTSGKHLAHREAIGIPGSIWHTRKHSVYPNNIQHIRTLFGWEENRHTIMRRVEVIK